MPKVTKKVICSNICEALFFDGPTMVWPSFTTSRDSENQSKTDKNRVSKTNTAKTLKKLETTPKMGPPGEAQGAQDRPKSIKKRSRKSTLEEAKRYPPLEKGFF